MQDYEARMIKDSVNEIGKHYYNSRVWFLAGGQFAIVSSAAGKAGVPFSGSYTGSKHAINVSEKYLRKGDFFQIGIYN